VSVGESSHDQPLTTAERAADLDFVRDAYQAMRLRVLAIHADLSALAHFLRFGPRLEEARDVQPYIEPHGFQSIVVDHCGVLFYSSRGRSHPD